MFCLSWVARMSPPPSSSSTLSLSRWKCCSCLSQCVCLFLIICTLYRTFTLLSPGIHILRSLTAVPFPPPPLPPSPPLLLSPSTSSLHYRLWSAVTLCIMVLHSAWTVSLRLRPLADGLQWHFVKCFTPSEVVGPRKRYPKAKIQIFNFWQMQIPKISLCPVSLSVFLSLPPCSMCIKRQTQHWL